MDQKPKRETAQKTEKKEDENVVFIGTKPFLNYVTSVVMQFTTKNRNTVIIKARGKFITRAVDVAEIVKRRFIEKKGVEVRDIKIGSEEFENKEGKKINVSTIEITLSKR